LTDCHLDQQRNFCARRNRIRGETLLRPRVEEDMATQNAAREIVAIQNRLVSETMPVRDRRLLLARQAEMWDRQFPNTPFEQVARRAA